MNLTPPKLKPLHIGIIALILVLIIGAAAAQFVIMPVMKDNQSKQAQLADLDSKGSPANQAAADKLMATNKAKAQQAMLSWHSLEARYFRVGPAKQVLDLSKPIQANDALAEEQNILLRDELVRWLDSGGNKVLTPPTVDPKGPNPNDLGQQTDVIRIGAKGIKIQGTWPSIMRLLRSTRQGPRLVTIDAITLSSAQVADTTSIGGITDVSQISNATSDTVIADMDMTVYVYPRNGDKFTPILQPGADTGGTSGSTPMPGGPGAPGGMPVPGGPPMPGGPNIRPPGPGGAPRPMG